MVTYRYSGNPPDANVVGPLDNRLADREPVGFLADRSWLAGLTRGGEGDGAAGTTGAAHVDDAQRTVPIPIVSPTPDPFRPATLRPAEPQPPFVPAPPAANARRLLKAVPVARHRSGPPVKQRLRALAAGVIAVQLVIGVFVGTRGTPDPGKAAAADTGPAPSRGGVSDNGATPGSADGAQAPHPDPAAAASQVAPPLTILPIPLPVAVGAMPAIPPVAAQDGQTSAADGQRAPAPRPNRPAPVPPLHGPVSPSRMPAPSRALSASPSPRQPPPSSGHPPPSSTPPPSATPSPSTGPPSPAPPSTAPPPSQGSPSPAPTTITTPSPAP